MDSEYIQFVRYKLQKRLKRLNSADFQGFHIMLIQVWGFLQENAITKGILDDLERRFQILNKTPTRPSPVNRKLERLRAKTTRSATGSLRSVRQAKRQTLKSKWA